MGKNLSEGKRVQYPLVMGTASLKTLSRKTQWEKNLTKEKRVQSPPLADII